MKKCIILFVVLMFSIPVFATNYSGENLSVKSNVGLNFVEVYNLHEIGTIEKTFIKKDANGQELVFKIGFNLENKISYILVSDNVSKARLELMRVNANNIKSFLACTRGNRCSDKPTSAGVIGCYGECALGQL